VRLLVTGSRTWHDQTRLSRELSVIHDRLARTSKWRYIQEGLTLVSGHCPQGADRLAENWAHSLFGIDVETHPAEWQVHGRAAGIIRNHEMVDLGADACAAFLMPCAEPKCRHYGKPDHYSHGGTDCAYYARSRGIPVTFTYGEET
jgi:hypothetical protein